jgi:hypothetical protein
VITLRCVVLLLQIETFQDLGGGIKWQVTEALVAHDKQVLKNANLTATVDMHKKPFRKVDPAKFACTLSFR